MIETPIGWIIEEVAGMARKLTVRPPNLDMIFEDLWHQYNPETDGLYGTESNRLGFQIWAWSFIRLLQDDIITPDGFLSKNAVINIGRSAIREPGGKVRLVTKSPAALIVYGQPFAHCVKEALQADPVLHAGLEAGWMAFEFYKRMS